MALQPLAGWDPAQIAGYQLQARLGAGRTGVVYLARDTLGRPVALKVMRPEFGQDPAFRDRFRQQVAAARRVSGPFAAPVLDADPDADLPWLVRPYVPGPSLAQAVAAHGPLPALSVLWLVRSVAEALTAIHAAGMVHQDLRPPNVLLAADGPWVTDLGIARALEATPPAQTAGWVGSPQFLAPEQARGEPAGPATDVWALGALGCFAATGRAPFGDEGGEQAMLDRVLHQEPDLGGCPPEVAAVLTPCLAADPQARPLPAQVSEHCRTVQPGGAAQAGRSWPPPALAADLPEYAPPVPGLGPVPGPGPVMPVPGLGSPGSAGPRSQGPPPAMATTYAGPPGAPTGPMSGPPAQDGIHLSRRALAACAAAAVVVIAGVAYGAVALTSHGGGNSGTNGTVNSKTHNLVRPTDAPTQSIPAPSPSSTLDSCLFGTWKQTLEQFPNTINGNPVTMSGGYGMTWSFSPNGAATVQYGSGTTWTATVNGNRWSQVDIGSATFDYTTQDGMLLYSDVNAHGTQTLYNNGSYNNGGPLTLNTEPDRYTCSGNSLEVFAPNGDTEILTRE